MTYNDDLRNIMLAHAVFLERLKKHTATEAARAIAKGDKPLERWIIANANKLKGGKDKEKAFIASLVALRKPLFEDMGAELIAMMKQYAEYEALFTAEALIATVPVQIKLNVPVRETLSESLDDLAIKGKGALPTGASADDGVRPIKAKASKVFDSLEKQVNVAYGETLENLLKGMRNEDIDAIKKAVQIGLSQGEDTATIAKRVSGTPALQRVDGVTQRSRNKATTLARTVINDTQSKAREALYEANADLVGKVQFLATLDSRTSAVCRARDGRVYERKKAPKPPLHPNCRSVLIPVIVTDTLPNRPYKSVTERQLRREWAEKTGAPLTGALPKGTRSEYNTFARKRTRELTGIAREGSSYQVFLSEQTASFQDDILGKAKGALFRKGGITLERFVDAQGREYTLKDLAKREQKAFKQAGLDLEKYL